MEHLSLRRRIYDRGLRGLLYLCAALTIALLVFMIGYVFYRGLGGITWEFLTTQRSLIRGTDGILPNILNTLYIILLSMVIVLPLGVGAAIYLTEYATNHKLVSIIEFATETLTGIPSIIFGLVGMLFFQQVLGFKYGILGGGLTLVIGRSGPGRRQVAHGAHRGAAQRRGRHRHRLHPGRGPYRGRVCRSALHRRYGQRGQQLL